MPRTRSTGAAHFERGKPFASSRFPGGAPTDITLSPSTVSFTVPVGTTVGNLTTVDPDTTGTQVDQPVYTIVGGADAAKFAIKDNRTIVTAVTGTGPFGGAGSKTVQVKATDMFLKTFTKSLTITVTT